ncbi:hypothetical protein [Sporomusa malonica]|uniref:Uncharacterized protein n=1 Tax=Sporomusa malonica TaxID=112901 RepID=A0A1W2EGB4_9FIRM|nr:hypothetical protein [Sporomusa malonica]SMD08794.1 hypothetical protein SAMN04488500_12412 [Sporomusa malonica]
MGDIGIPEYQYLLGKLDELEKKLCVHQVRINLLIEEHKRLVKTLKALGLDEFNDIEE